MGLCVTMAAHSLAAFEEAAQQWRHERASFFSSSAKPTPSLPSGPAVIPGEEAPIPAPAPVRRPVFIFGEVPDPAPSPPPPATRLLRTLLGEAVPPEPPAGATPKQLVEWWGAVVEAVGAERRRRALPVLDGMQRRALAVVCDKATRASAAAIPHLHQRFKEQGLSESDLPVVLAWLLAGAPLIIHLNLRSVLKHLVQDDHYRNQFE